MKSTIKIFVALLFISLYSIAQTGKVVWVEDGDTFILKDKNNVKHTIRVADIDCPETGKYGKPGQPYSKSALKFTIKEIYGKIVTVTFKNYDKRDRIVGYVTYSNKDLGLELLKAGLAWHYKYYSDDPTMAKLETEAKENKLGLWQDLNPIQPYYWRKGQRN